MNLFQSNKITNTCQAGLNCPSVDRVAPPASRIRLLLKYLPTITSKCLNSTPLPQYSVYCCILSLVACGVFLRVSFELKVLFLTLASAAYYVIILSTQRALFVAYGNILYAPKPSEWNCSRWAAESTVNIETINQSFNIGRPIVSPQQRRSDRPVVPRVGQTPPVHELHLHHTLPGHHAHHCPAGRWSSLSALLCRFCLEQHHVKPCLQYGSCHQQQIH